jgi:diguanylate cyclase (GGDEF)-like protein
MQIDAFTILFAGIFVKLWLALLFFAFWLPDRRATWYAWWGATYFLGMLAAVIFLARGFSGNLSVIGAGTAVVIGALGCCWQGARAFHHRLPLLWPVVAALALWLGACLLLPGFLDNIHQRVILSSLLLAGLTAAAGVEFWRGRQERLLSRWPVIVLFGTFSLFFLSRIAFVNVLPFPLGALAMQAEAVAAFNMVAFFHTLILTVLFVAITKERLERAQRLNALTDPLTGALNRRALMARGARILARHDYDKAPLCLLLLDLDRFKALNDRFGHLGGDDVLTGVVGVVQNSMRPSDFLFRLGGEEFCCLLPHTQAVQGQVVAERIRAQVENAAFGVAGMTVKVTVSLGLASTEGSGYDIDALIRRADVALYAAKRQGRNRVVVAEAGETPKPAPVLSAGMIQPAAAPG